MGNKKESLEYKSKYELYRHHAWAGLGLLSVFLAIHYFYPTLPIWISFPVLIGLIVYVLIGLIGTYKYRTGLKVQDGSSLDSLDNVQESLEKKKKKEKAKTEKKRLKAHVKKMKKK